MASRTVEDEKEKKMTIILTPFIPCASKLPIIALFASFFFSSYAWLVTFSLYVFAIAIIILSALVMKKFIFKVLCLILEWALYITFGLIVAISIIAIICGNGDKGLLDLIAE